MLNLRKNALALAVAAAALGGGISTAQDAQAQAVSGNGLGQALIYPYYSVRDGWRTFIHVTNTSDQTVAVKVRFHEPARSVDILDFALVLSPRDMWTAVAEERGGVPGLRPTDNSCTVPDIGSATFLPFDPNGTTGLTADAMREGYVEIIQMGSPDLTTAAGAAFAQAAAHVHTATSDIPANCSTIATAFATTAAIQTALTVWPVNVLAGKYDLINVNAATASTSAARAVAIEDFNTGVLAYPQVGGTTANNLDMPNLACVGKGANPATCADPTLLETALGATAISNEWVLNPGLGELSSWVLTFPTKYLSVSTGVDGIFPPQAPPVCGSLTVNAVPVTVTLFNREERATSVNFSPAVNVLCNEANVVNFTSGSLSSATLLSSSVAKTINVDALKSPFLGGWARFVHNPTAAGAAISLPAVGFNLTARTKLGDAVLYDHVYEGRP